MPLPSVLVGLIEDYLFPSFAEPLVKIDEIELPALTSDEARKGFEIGLRGDEKELTETRESLAGEECTKENIRLVDGIIMGIATAGHSLDLYDIFGEIVYDTSIHEQAAYQARLHRHALAYEIASDYWRFVDMSSVEDNIILHGPASEAIHMIKSTDPTSDDMDRVLLLALQRGERKVFDAANEHASTRARLDIICDLAKMKHDAGEIFRAISIVAMPGVNISPI